jgi:hypothetical protein
LRRLAAPASDVAAVNGNFRTADEARLVRRDEQHQIGENGIP